jgi:YgiT-type zinc finger domain-containing protein
MAQGLQDKEEAMRCYQCGAKMEQVTTDLPFKIHTHSIVIVKNLPVWQCGNCNEYLLEDTVMNRVDGLINKVDASVEVEILSYAA